MMPYGKSHTIKRVYEAQPESFGDLVTPLTMAQKLLDKSPSLTWGIVFFKIKFNYEILRFEASGG